MRLPVQGRELVVLIFILLLLAVLALMPGSQFLLAQDRDGDFMINKRPILNILTRTAYLAVEAVGMTMVIVAGQIDLSVGSTLAVCAQVAGYSAKWGLPIPLVILLSVAVGTLVGTVNGFLVSRGRVHSIIVTLGMMIILRGIILWATGQRWLTDLPDGFRYLGKGYFLFLPVPIWFVIIFVPIGAYLLANTPLGRKIYAVGGNPSAAVLSGISVPNIHLLVLAANGALVGLGTMINATRYSTIEANIGSGDEFRVITAVVVGGTSIFGGSGSVMGTLLGVLLVGIIQAALNFWKIPSIWEAAVYGSLILITVVVDALRARRHLALGGAG
jgi:ribose/xylose/arabinose/galactoside ABC-type transport system permease subunit